jgi:hypothetical protein
MAHRGAHEGGQCGSEAGGQHRAGSTAMAALEGREDSVESADRRDDTDERAQSVVSTF